MSAPTSAREAAFAPLWLIAAGLGFSTMGALVRYTAETQGLHPFQIGFFRNLFVLLPMLLLRPRLGVPLLPDRHRWLYAVRGLFEFAALLAWFTAVSLIPLGDFTAIGFTSVLIAALIARVVLGEALGFDRLLAIAAGLAGALIIVRPSAAGLSVGALAAFLSAALIGISRITARILAKTDPPSRILFYFLLYTTPLSAVAAAFTWTSPSPAAFGLCILVAAAGSIGQYGLARAYRHADVAALAPFDFLQIPIATLIGFLVFAQVPDLVSALGAAIVVAAVLYTINRERVRRRAAIVAGTIPPGGSSPK